MVSWPEGTQVAVGIAVLYVGSVSGGLLLDKVIPGIRAEAQRHGLHRNRLQC